MLQTLPARWSHCGPVVHGVVCLGPGRGELLGRLCAAGRTSSAICEAFGWERGADRSWDEAPVYRGIITAIIGISAVLVLMPGVDLFQIMMTSQVINGVLLPVVLVFQVVIAADRHIMGANRNGRVWNVLTWATIGVITVLTVVMFVLQAMGYSA